MSHLKNYTEQGGEKTVIGGKLEITSEGAFILFGAEIQPIHNQEESHATTVKELKDDFNALLVKLKQAGFMRDE